MPELPEVQTIVNDLNKKIIKRKITGVWFDAPKIIKKPAVKEFEKQIKGLKIIKVERRGKNILVHLTKNYKLKAQSYLLLIHQKMTGHLLVGKWKRGKGKWNSLIKGVMDEKVNNYIHIIFYLDNGFQLALSDLRKFAKIMFGPEEEIKNLPDIKDIGIDPFDKKLSLKVFKEIIGSQKRPIKEVLMEQKLISGIGNIYSDEILWLAKIHPLRSSNNLSDMELKSIYNSMKVILKKAIKLRGTSISDYRDASGKPGMYGKERYVYRKEGELCPRGDAVIVRIKVKNNRSAHFCPVCQKM